MRYCSISYDIIIVNNQKEGYLQIDNPFLFYVEFIVTADVGNFLLFQVYNTLNSYPSSFRKSMARGNAYCRFPLHQDFKESWKVMMEPLRA